MLYSLGCIMAKTTLIRCPVCQKEADFFAEPLGAFCSQRCKLVDLGKWLGEEYCVSEPLRPDLFESDEDAPEANLDDPD